MLQLEPSTRNLKVEGGGTDDALERVPCTVYSVRLGAGCQRKKNINGRGAGKCQPEAGGADGGDCYDGCGRWSATSGGDNGEGERIKVVSKVVVLNDVRPVDLADPGCRDV